MFKRLSILHKRCKVLLVVSHVLDHGPPQGAVVAVAVAKLVGEGSEQTVAGREEE